MLQFDVLGIDFRFVLQSSLIYLNSSTELLYVCVDKSA